MVCMTFGYRHNNMQNCFLLSFFLLNICTDGFPEIDILLKISAYLGKTTGRSVKTLTF